MTCSKCGAKMAYEKTLHLPVSHYVDGWEPGWTERVDIWKCPECGPKTAALNTIESLMKSGRGEPR